MSLKNRIVTVMKANKRRGFTVSELTEKLDAMKKPHENFTPLSSIRARLTELSQEGVVDATGKTRRSLFNPNMKTNVFKFYRQTDF